MAAKKGVAILGDKEKNKDSAFTGDERKKLKLEGLLPMAVESPDLQVRRETAIIDDKTRRIDKYMHLMNLQSRNETLFFKLICSDIRKFMPLVYTPTVGEACEKYSHIWSGSKGIYIPRTEGVGKKEIYQMLCNWKTRNVKAIVFTDGQRILGLGDLGVNGMGIPVGKLQLYSACAGIPPSQCLPVCIDNGTNTERYLEDDLYMGMKKKRKNDEEYFQFIHDFMEAATKAFGRSVLLQFEDFGNDTAFHLLQQNMYKFNCFNDDIQGTACVALGGVLSALKMDGVPSNLADHKVLFLGAGEAGCGIGELIAYAIEKQTEGAVSIEEARTNNIFFADSRGLISTARKDNLAHHKLPFVKGTDLEIKDFAEIVKALKPTMIVGVSAQPGTFTKEVCNAMAEFNERPIIFALSNPTKKAECTAQQAYEWTEDRCIFASGSPFPDYEKDGKLKYRPGQGNNAYIFPGLALGCIAAEAKFIPQELFYIAAETLADMVDESDHAIGNVYPSLEKIRRVSLNIAAKVATACFEGVTDPRTGEKVILAQCERKDTSVLHNLVWLEEMMDENEYLSF